MSERETIERLRKLFPRIGDDAAVVGNQVITTDMLIEGVDFTRAVPLQLIARKSLVANLSDLAAMGARPSHAVVSLATRDESDVEPFMVAIAETAARYGIEIVGGDLSGAPQLIVSITAVGIADRPLLRSGARPGDRIYVSRPLGASAAGLEMLQRWSSMDPPSDLGYSARELAQSAIRRHVDPEPELQLGIVLAGIREVTACIDISDGLSTDLHHLCRESGVGAEVERARIPVFADLPAHAQALGVNVRNAVLHGGEEYALMFTSSLREGDLSTRAGRPVYNIGKIVEQREVKLDGELLEARGWDHFG